MKFHFLNKDESADYLLGSLYYRAGDSSNAAAYKLGRALRWYQMLLGGTALEGAARIKLIQKSQLPLCFVYDVGYLLLETTRFNFRYELGDIDPNLLIVYSDSLNRLLADRSFQEAANWLQGNPGQDDLVAWLIGKVLDVVIQADPTYDFNISMSVIKQLALDSAYGEHALSFEDSHGSSLKDEILLMADLRNRYCRRPIFSPEIIETVKYWKAFKNPFARAAGKKILSWAQIFPEFDPRRMHVRHEEELETKLSQPGSYPMGGITGITTSGKIESLLPSEMVYMDILPYESSAFDLFSLKYMGIFGDLLYFEREGGTMQRIKRVVHIVVDPSRHRFPIGQGIYSLHAVYGLIISLIKKLIQALPSAIEIHLHILNNESENKWIKVEQAIIEVLLEWEISRGYVTLDTPSDLDVYSLKEEKKRVYALSVYDGVGVPPGLSENITPKIKSKGDPNIVIWQMLGIADLPNQIKTSWPSEMADLAEHFEIELNIVHDNLLRWVLNVA